MRAREKVVGAGEQEVIEGCQCYMSTWRNAAVCLSSILAVELLVVALGCPQYDHNCNKYDWRNGREKWWCDFLCLLSVLAISYCCTCTVYYVTSCTCNASDVHVHVLIGVPCNVYMYSVCMSHVRSGVR